VTIPPNTRKSFEGKAPTINSFGLFILMSKIENDLQFNNPQLVG
tara:strand:- start:262 stop:393 length:132 start_codon:yes stop_codon:yes gene_type:complete